MKEGPGIWLNDLAWWSTFRSVAGVVSISIEHVLTPANHQMAAQLVEISPTTASIKQEGEGQEEEIALLIVISCDTISRCSVDAPPPICMKFKRLQKTDKRVWRWRSPTDRRAPGAGGCVVVWLVNPVDLPQVHGCCRPAAGAFLSSELGRSRTDAVACIVRKETVSEAPSRACVKEVLVSQRYSFSRYQTNPNPNPGGEPPDPR
ncbi:hypothetical protein V8F20_002245 [Naviculisporaceae sp. PSN 640]